MAEDRSINQLIENVKNPAAIGQEIAKLGEKRKAIEERLQALEKQIYALEGNYLTDTNHLGNILTGWDSYLSSRSGALKRPMKFKESDRLFSLSSATAFRTCGVKEGPGSDTGDSDATAADEPEPPQPPKSEKGPGRPRRKRDEDD